ncbi:Fic family protein [Candidatus Woesearchaeota archaeon]|nr:Fic family protein [Candidatus Woesearchaeota archaeon]
MKFIRKKIINGNQYFYFDYSITLENEKRIHYTRYLGHTIPENLKEQITEYFNKIAERIAEEVSLGAIKYFPPNGIITIEWHRARYTCLQQELYENDRKLFGTLFTILFMLNSNRAEGSNVTRPDIEKIMKRRIKPKTRIDKEIIGSIDAINFAFSKKLRWNRAGIKKIHYLLFKELYPEIAGKYKRVNNIVGSPNKGLLTTTTEWQEVPKAMKKLLQWVHMMKKKKIYPPILALEFHWRFEAIHPFEDGNGRVGRILLNTMLLENGFMPVIYFSQNHRAYCDAIAKARDGKKMPLAKHFVDSVKKTYTAVEEYKKEGIVKGGSPAVKQWEITRQGIRIY